MKKSVKHKESGLPKKYVGKLSDSTARARKAHWKKMSKYSDRDPRAYEPAPGDATAKTKPSKATREVRKMMNKEEATLPNSKTVKLKKFIKQLDKSVKTHAKQRDTLKDIVKMVEEVEITEEASKSLAAKAKKTGIPLSTLKTVYRRGVAAWNSGHRPGTTAQQWGHARVNSYIRKGKGTYYGADKDLREQNMVHSVHVSGEDDSKKFKNYVKGWGGKLHYVSDKGVAYKFNKPYQARGFHAGIKTGFRHLDSQQDGQVREAKDPREYGFEGEMAMSQLKGIMNHAQQLNDMLNPETDLPEWVQSKITKAYDYIQTAADYMATEMKEEVQQVDEFMGPIPAPGPESIAHRKANTAMRLNVADARRKARLAKKKTAMEDIAVNSVGSGNVAGLQGDPPVHKKKKKKLVMSLSRFMKK